ncbi:MAG: sugar phosphate nucleotidyltransferase [Thermodesulfobacteriota bacterium]|nr:sugar phosphate nucleotidyltransferase [Thermodesulfobacteriota bacterium]
MKAMILAAGLGTRLLPLTKKKPKPLFPILGQPLLDILIQRLQAAGCDGVIINTHHLAHVIHAFVQEKHYGIDVQTRREPTILGTGGAIKNVESFWDEAPFLVINGDILTDIDFKEVYRFHLGHRHPVTLVLHDCDQYNHVWIDNDDCVRGVGHPAPCPPVSFQTRPGSNKPVSEDTGTHRRLAFTGIQVLDPKVLTLIPKGRSCSIIDVYCDMIRSHRTVKGFIARNHYWHDIGTLEGYQAAVQEALTRRALAMIGSTTEKSPLAWSNLKGDGSERRWYRVSRKETTLVLVDHGPPSGDNICEADSFFAIGRHLHNRGVAVPRIYGYDRPSGLVALEDLGDLHLQTLILRTQAQEKVIASYSQVLDLLVLMGVEGAKGFDPAFSYETPQYDEDLILNKEARYFVDAFLNGYMGLGIDFEDLHQEFKLLAQRALYKSHIGFMHRDFQSRNIMIKDNRCYAIDFQGGRLGPLAYDLASLLIDPYVQLPQRLQKDLLSYYIRRLQAFVAVDPLAFFHTYTYCAINRNLQILGAFAFLGKKKGKQDFKKYIPQAVRSLKRHLRQIEPETCVRLHRIAEGL